MTVVIGMTGTRRLVPDDAQRIEAILAALPPNAVLVTGGCVGSDAVAAEVWHRLGRRVHTVLPEDRTQVDPYWDFRCDTYEEVEGSYRLRNARIVEWSQRLVAFPNREEARDLRSGTWMTVRLARHKGIPIDTHILHPSGGG